MKVGDPKQARILSVIAVGAVAFVIIQLLPGGGSTVGKVSQQIQDRLQGRQDANKEADSSVRAFPPMLARNVFDHPYLAKSKPESPDAERVEAKKEKESAETSNHVPPALPGLPPLEATPSESSEVTQTEKKVQEVAKPIILTLEGVILKPSPTALLRVDQESVTPAVGDIVARGYRLTKITEDGVILSRKGKKKTVPVGGSLTL